MPLIGLTGGLASGKSAVSSIFAGFGARIIDCDELAREVVGPGGAGIAMVVSEFGRDVLLEDGGLDRKRLGAIVFDDEGKRKRLESILHPLIIALAIERAGAILRDDADAVVIVDAALLFETDLDKKMDQTIAVVCAPWQMAERAGARDGMTEEMAGKVIDSQWPLSEKAASADYVIDNSGDLDDTVGQAEEVWEGIVAKR